MSKESKAYKNLPKKVYIRTFGCQMNVRDSEVICGLLKAEGYELIADYSEADVILFNTCSVRQHAEDKVWSEIGRLKKMGAAPERGLSSFFPIIGIVGCMAQNYKEQIFERAPEVDFVVGPGDIHKIPEILKKIGTVPKRRGQSLFLRKIWETSSEARPEEIYHTGFREDKEHAFTVISEGCDNFCAYCVVPHTRGHLRHRAHEDILKEIREAVDKGITKFTLLGQNVNSYRPPGHPATRPPVNFMELLRLINQIKGIEEFSFITSHPKDAGIDLFKAMAECDKLKKYLHLPAQSGSNRILELMNRRYTKEFYLDLTEKYRKIVKNGLLSTDIIVGFPTETEADFEDTFNLVKQVEFDSAFIFKYSPRPGTAALKLKDDVPRQEKERRHALILELQKGISHKTKGNISRRPDCDR